MPNASTKNISTLSHLYNTPVQHRRDFVRENKENVRKQQQPKEKPQIDGYMPFSSSADQISSRSTGFTEAIMEQRAAKKLPTSTPNNSKLKKPRSPPVKKKQFGTFGFGRDTLDRKNEKKPTKNDNTMLPPVSMSKRPFSDAKVKVVTINKPKANTSTIAVQTDEINDEIYLYNALKKCASPAFKSALKAKYLQRERDSHQRQSVSVSTEMTLPLDDSFESPQEKQQQQQRREKLQQKHQTGVVCNREHVRQEGGNAQITVKPQHNSQQQLESLQTNFSQDSQRSCLDYQDVYHHRKQSNQLPSNLNVMTMSTDGVNNCSATKCTNCPEGYHLLSEEEREIIRAKLLEHEALLIRQLNSFPLAIETLRVRQSKTRIEKELSILEQNLRKLTKRKVYAKIN